MDGDIDMKFKKVIKAILFSSIIFNYSLNCFVMVDANSSINQKTESWELGVANMSVSRNGHGAITKDKKIYIIGGASDNGTYLNTVEVYDIKTKTWETKASMPVAKAGFATEIVGDNIYCIGGYDGANRLASTHVYNISSDTWTTKESMPTPRAFLSSAAIGNTIYCIGGSDAAGGKNTVEAYDIATNTWTTKAQLSEYKDGLSTVVANGKIYAFGGIDVLTAYKTVEMYNPDTDSWTLKADMPSSRALFDAVEINGYVYCIGGVTDFYSPIASFDIYDIANDKWVTKTDLANSKYSYSAVEIDGFIYTIGGCDNAGTLSSINRYATEYAVSAPFTSTNNIDVYIKPQNILSLSMDTNSITFDEFDGVASYEMSRAVNLSIESNLPYNLYASLEAEISNADNSKTIDKSILGIKESSMSSYESFPAIKQDILLKDGNLPGKSEHGIDLILRNDVPYEVDVYKTTIKIKVEQQ